MAFKTLSHLTNSQPETRVLKIAAYLEVALVSILFLLLICFRYLTPVLSHELFMELLLLLGVGIALDHYTMTLLLHSK